LLELAATLATDEMVMMLDVSVGFGSMHFPVKISNFFFSAPVRNEASTRPPPPKRQALTCRPFKNIR